MGKRNLMKDALKTIKALGDINMAYRIGGRPKESSLDWLHDHKERVIAELQAAEEGKAEPRPGTDGGPAGQTELQEAGRVIIDLCTALESVADVEGSASAEVKAAWGNGCRWMAGAHLEDPPTEAEGVEGAKVIWDGGYGMVQLALDGVRGMLYGRPDRRELWTLLARLDHPITWATGEFTAQWAFYNMLMAWTPEQCREFYAMLSRRPDFNPKAPNHEFSASEVDPSHCGLCLEHRRDHGTRPGGLRSIEQAARGPALEAGALEAWQSLMVDVATYIQSKEDIRSHTKITDGHRLYSRVLERVAYLTDKIHTRDHHQTAQAPTAQSAPPPAGPTSQGEADEPKYICLGCGDMDAQAVTIPNAPGTGDADEGCAKCGSSDFAESPEEAIARLVKHSAASYNAYIDSEGKRLDLETKLREVAPPRPMNLDVIVSKFDSSKHLSHLQVTSVNRGGFAQTCPQEIAEEIAARLLAFEAPSPAVEPPKKDNT